MKYIKIMELLALIFSIKHNKNKTKEIAYLSVSDYPNIKKRGLMLDISRGKIPTIESLKKLIEFVSKKQMRGVTKKY